MNIPFEDLFFDEVSKHNSFLITHGCDESHDSSDWFISVEYDSPSIYVHYSFGDKDLLFNTVISVKKHGNREYGLWEWADALGLRSEYKITDNLVSDKNALLTLITNSSALLEKNLSTLLNSNKYTISKMEDARAIVRKQWESK